jgi:microcystin-dependent protein
MKKITNQIQKLILISLAIFSVLSLKAQVGIGNNAPDATSILDLSNTTNLGFLLPRKSVKIANGTQGLLYYDTGKNLLMYSEGAGVYNGLSPWKYKYNDATTNFTYFNGGNVGIGADTPQQKLHILSSGVTLALEGVSNSTRLAFYGNTYANGETGNIGFQNSSDLLIENKNANSKIKLSPTGSGVVETTKGITVTSGNVNAVAGKVQEGGNDLLPRGAIIMWSGTAIPAGWILCNGGEFTSGSTLYKTPDLRGRFIVGYHSGDADYNSPGSLSTNSKATSGVGKTGGDKSVSLAKEHIPKHNHSLKNGTDNCTSEIPEGGKHEHTISVNGVSVIASFEENNHFFTNPAARDDGKRFNYDTKEDGGHGHSVKGNTGDGGSGLSGTAHENRPPYYTLAFIMKK